MIILVEPKYNPDLQGRITSSTQLGPGITCAKFLGALGSRTQFEKLYSKGFSGSANRNQIARNLVPHSHAMQVFYSNPLFAQHRLTVSDGIYEPNPKFQVTESKQGSELAAKLVIQRIPNASYGKGPDGWVARIPQYVGESPSSDSINDLRREGRTIGYQVVDKFGKSDPRMAFDLAVYWKDYINYDKITLYYDTFDPSGQLTSTIFLEMPEVPSSFDVSYKYDLETIYNGELQAKNELLEILPD